MSFKKSSFFSDKQIFSLQKNQNKNVLRIFTISVPFSDKYAIISKIQKLKSFFQKTLFFRNYPKIRTFWEVLLFQSHYTTNLLLLPIFKIFIFFKKSVTFLRKKWTFWEILNFQSHSSTFLLSFAIFKTWCFFWKNSSNFFSKIKFWTFWKLLLFLSLSKANLLLLPIFKLLFFSKIHQFLGKKWTFWEIVIIAEKSHSTATLLSLAILKNSCFFR